MVFRSLCLIVSIAFFGTLTTPFALSESKSDPAESSREVIIEYDPDTYTESDFHIAKRAVEKLGCVPVKLEASGFFGDLITISTNDVEIDVEHPASIVPTAARYCGITKSRFFILKYNPNSDEFNRAALNGVVSDIEAAGCKVRTEEMRWGKFTLKAPWKSGNNVFNYQHPGSLGGQAIDLCEDGVLGN